MSKLVSREMKGLENVLVDLYWLNWVRVNQGKTWNIKLESLEQMRLAIDYRKKRLWVFSLWRLKRLINRILL